jgi:hypothetical protein
MEQRSAVRVRRARREDVGKLAERAGGPAAGRIRAVRRLLKTLVADVYVLERDRGIDGVVAVTYRRSLAEGGLQATIDSLHCLGPGDAEERQADLLRLLDCALSRAERRGCVAVVCTSDSGEVREELLRRGFAAGPPRLRRRLATRAEGEEEA